MTEHALLGERAVVVGGSIAGLLTARVLSDHYRAVVVLDRDTLATKDHRKGVPQSRHAHALLAGGRLALEDLLPGLTDRLVERGAPSGDLQASTIWINEGHVLARDHGGLRGVLTSRLLLEDDVRSTVTAIGNVDVVDRCEAVGLVVTPSGRVQGVRIADRDHDAEPEVLAADLVVDATGRGSRLPAWLQGLGYGAPPVDEIVVGLSYTTFEFERPTPDEESAAIVVAATVERPRAGVLLPQPDGRWVATIGGYLGDAAPTDLAGFRAFAATLATPHLADALEGLVPIGEARTFKYHASTWRRYDRMRRFPDGLLAIGDSICSFNPIFGQGMSVAAREAVLLRDCLASGGTRRLARRFFRRTVAAIAGPWEVAASSDLRFPAVEGRRSLRTRMVNRYLPRYFRAAAHDPELALRFLRVVNLLAPPQSLLAPPALLRVLGHRHPSTPSTPRPQPIAA